jgi:hypothetical protein
VCVCGGEGGGGARNKDCIVVGHSVVGHNRDPVGFMSMQIGIWSAVLVRKYVMTSRCF